MILTHGVKVEKFFEENTGDIGGLAAEFRHVAEACISGMKYRCELFEVI